MDTQSLAAYAHALQDPFIGSFISLIFYGVSCVQTLFYFQTYPDDGIWLKILESAHSAFLISFNNSYLIVGFGDLVALDHIACLHHTRMFLYFELQFVVILIVNLFFTWRVWMFSRKAWAVCLLVPLAVTMGAGVLGDTLMASILAYYLHSKRTQGSAQLITRLMGYVVGTGAFTRHLRQITASPNSLLYVAFAVIQVKIYANSALLS
ncbi:hypothetical protein V8B97DRAFT_2022353 [Scleroderma yunnanense]